MGPVLAELPVRVELDAWRNFDRLKSYEPKSITRPCVRPKASRPAAQIVIAMKPASAQEAASQSRARHARTPSLFDVHAPLARLHMLLASKSFSGEAINSLHHAPSGSYEAAHLSACTFVALSARRVALEHAFAQPPASSVDPLPRCRLDPLPKAAHNYFAIAAI